ncbi:Murein DD-endopeptidase MepM and murein hydrolase activator NlpD, contain LysM domain [Saccharopolyspora flava]|uniref:Murein DD-endopeptidase MepM and murein hydrolase activator NlpD, contain LysM domain n=2 Tax=Saccharopolyspora flava TaxID=95161 RepID=A0A1I6NXV4_9PSEU|nr:Murein DD-endopeptidase MepM and murein hydrolase activator NlpD, contain LysM domain [Saccharopolyspora flava]
MMGKHRKEDRLPPTAGRPIRNKVVAAVVAGGAFAAVGQPLSANAGSEQERDVQNLAKTKNLSTAITGTQNSPAAVRLLQAQQPARPEAQELAKAKAIEAERIIREEAARQAAIAAAEAQRAAEEQARKAAGFHVPAEGTYTSGFGSRWGSSHMGIDIANSIGTPIYSVAPGEVIDAGPASGFGLWVRVQHDDGTITVYGHVNTIVAEEGQRVGAGEQIATMGNRGQSTGPHLHFEVHEDGTKINPLPWLRERGIDVT